MARAAPLGVAALGVAARWLVAAGLLAQVSFGASSATAQAGDAAAASDAFTRAQQAELSGDWATATELYTLADHILPSPEALRAAARAAQRAGMPATAATHATTMLARDASERESRAVAEEILAATEGTLGRLDVTCADACRVLIDGRLATLGSATHHALFTSPGERTFTVSYDDESQAPAQTVEVRAGERHALTFTPAPSPSPATEAQSAEAPTDEGSSGISPWFFVGGVALTVAAGAVLTWSAIDVLDAHADYDPNAPDARTRYEDGRMREDRTNVLIGVTSGLAAVTIVLAIFTDWGSRDDGASTAASFLPYASVSQHGATLGAVGTF